MPHKVAIKMSAGLYVNINQFLTNGEQIGRRTYKTGGIRNKGIFHCEPFSNKDLGLYSLNFLVLAVAPSDEISLNRFLIKVIQMHHRLSESPKVEQLL